MRAIVSDVCCLCRSKQNAVKEVHGELSQKKPPIKRAKDAKAINEEEEEKVDVGPLELDAPVRKSARARRPAIKEVSCYIARFCRLK